MHYSIHSFDADTLWDTEPDTSLDGPQTLVVVFAEARLSAAVQQQIQKLAQQFAQSILIGCSSAGEICGAELLDNSLVVAVIHFTHTRLRLAQQTILAAQQSAEVGASIAKQLDANDLKAVFTLTDGLLVNGSDYIQALDLGLPTEVVITGGLAADGDRFEQTWVLCNGEITSGKVAAVGFYGDAFQVTHGSKGGWDLLGHEREVTRAEKNVLYSLDSQPALEVYKKYLGERAHELPATGLLFPLAIRNDEEADNLTVRTILGIDEEDQSITFAGNIPEGSRVNLMRANFDRLIDGAAEAAESLPVHGCNGAKAICLAISCVGRRLVLGPRVEEELEAVREAIPQGCRLLGYYSYGEISPLSNERCDLHNQTMTLSVFWEQE